MSDKKQITASTGNAIAKNIRYVKHPSGLSKNEWISVARLQFKFKNKMPCFVCGKHQQFVHAHHIFPLSIQYDLLVLKPNHRFVWLCPTHHAIAHYDILNMALGNNRETQEYDEEKALLKIAEDFLSLYSKAAKECEIEKQKTVSLFMDVLFDTCNEINIDVQKLERDFYSATSKTDMFLIGNAIKRMREFMEKLCFMQISIINKIGEKS